ncbi:hypothetical protein J1TS5_33050 [Paenibacillus macerans]|nr:hypothetical protein J1TS5_33050 [Paenibacillus macerans]
MAAHPKPDQNFIEQTDRGLAAVSIAGAGAGFANPREMLQYVNVGYIGNRFTVQSREKVFDVVEVAVLGFL